MKQYKLVNKIDRDIWRDFVCQHSYGNIFQSPEMFDVWNATKNMDPVLFAVLDENDHLCATLLSVIQKEYKGILGRFTARAVIWGGPLVSNNDSAILEFIIHQFNRFMKKKVIYSQFRNLWPQSFERDVFKKFSFHYDDHLNILVNLEQSEEKLWKEVHSKRRNEIRRAKREGTSMKELKDLEEIKEAYRILEDVYHRAGLPLPDESLFISAYEIFFPKDMIKFFGAMYKDRIIGTIVILRFKNVLYDWYAGSYRQYYNKYPNDLLPWEVFLWAKKEGFGIFDFGGAGKPGEPYGVRDYKKKFGGRFVHFGRYQMTYNPVLMEIGKLGLKIWKKI